MRHLLIVDDEAAIRAGLEASFRRRGWSAESAGGVNEAVEKFRITPAELVVTDLCMPDGDGLQVMHAVRRAAPGTPVILLTAYGDVPGAVQAMREGACDYFQKPVAFDDLEAAVKRFLGLGRQAAESASGFSGIASSAAMQAVLARARQVAQTGADVLIEAESGTGKELLAKFIHRNSKRSAGPFVAVNCAAFPDHLLESELFGHVKGAFTGAMTTKPGKFALANGGSLLLDEIGEMPLSLQPKLLRALQEREIDRLGDTKPLPVDVRVMATTNRDLRKRIAEGQFREDLYYRLNVVPLGLPPLRERVEEIVPMAEMFLQKYADKNTKEHCEISLALAEQMKLHSWPGNVRELENFVRRALALRSGNILQPQAIAEGSAGLPGEAQTVAVAAGTTLQEAERRLLEKTLAATGGNRTQAARLMGISLRTVRNKIREYGFPARSLV